MILTIFRLAEYITMDEDYIIHLKNGELLKLDDTGQFFKIGEFDYYACDIRRLIAGQLQKVYPVCVYEVKPDKNSIKSRLVSVLSDLNYSKNKDAMTHINAAIKSLNTES